MPSIVLVSSRAEKWLTFTAELTKETGMEIITVRSGAEALGAVSGFNPVAMVIDENIGEPGGPALIRRIMAINAMIHVAWVSTLPADRFHEETEGLGLLMQLPPTPDAAEALHLAECLRRVSGAI